MRKSPVNQSSGTGELQGRFAARVSTVGELGAAMAKASEADTACYIEIATPMHDYPPATKVLGARWADLYGIAEEPGILPK